MASGDFIIAHETDVVLDNTQKLAFKSAVETVFTGSIANLTGLSLYKDSNGDWHCSLRGVKAVAPASLPAPCSVVGKVP